MLLKTINLSGQGSNFTMRDFKTNKSRFKRGLNRGVKYWLNHFDQTVFCPTNFLSCPIYQRTIIPLPLPLSLFFHPSLPLPLFPWPFYISLTLYFPPSLSVSPSPLILPAFLLSSFFSKWMHRQRQPNQPTHKQAGIRAEHPKITNKVFL